MQQLLKQKKHLSTNHPFPFTRPSKNEAARCHAQLQEAFSTLLGSDVAALEDYPSLTDLVTALASLAEGRRCKVVLSSTLSPIEFTFLRSQKDVLISIYETRKASEIFCLNRAIPLAATLKIFSELLAQEISKEPESSLRQAKARIVEKALSTGENLIPTSLILPIKRHGGIHELHAKDNPFAFGYQVSMYPSSATKIEHTHQADHHALLFEGSLWAWVRGKKIDIADGPIMPAVTCMMDAIEKLVDSSLDNFAKHYRVGTNDFWMSVRMEEEQNLLVTLNTYNGHQVSCGGLRIADFALPILRLGSELLRTLTQVDRNQIRSVNVQSLKKQIRSLRRRILEDQKKQKGFINLNPDWLRISNQKSPRDDLKNNHFHSTQSLDFTNSKLEALRFREAWQTEIDGLDPASTFLCQDQIILSSARAILSLSKNTGNLNWVRESQYCRLLMADSTLVELHDGGRVDFCDVEDGEIIFSCHTGTSFSSFSTASLIEGHAMPPMFLLCDGVQTLIAVDNRTGQVRWKYQNRERSCLRLNRSGRILLVASESGIVDAIDMVSGEVVWKYVQKFPIAIAPQVCDDIVIFASSNKRKGFVELHGIDLYSGLRVWKRRLNSCELVELYAKNQGAWAVLREGADTSLVALDVEEGTPKWAVADPGIDQGGTLFCADQSLVIHSPSSCTTGICAETGQTQWTRKLIDPIQDALPRVLESRLHRGVLYVPGSSVFVLCPKTGQDISDPISSSLVPDWLRVDERGWVFAAEEGGRISGFAPSPRLTLVQ